MTRFSWKQREGEQFANAFFDTETKIKIAKALDEFGVDYIELTSPAASEQSRADCEAICKLGLRAKVLTHIRCHMDDARIAVETGVDGVDVVIGTSSFLREHSHGKDMNYIHKAAIEVIEFVKSKNIEVRFSSEDSFRSDLVDLLSIYRTVDKIGVNRVGIADTVSPSVYQTDIRLAVRVQDKSMTLYEHFEVSSPATLNAISITTQAVLLQMPTVLSKPVQLTSILPFLESVNEMESPPLAAFSLACTQQIKNTSKENTISRNFEISKISLLKLSTSPSHSTITSRVTVLSPTKY